MEAKFDLTEEWVWIVWCWPKDGHINQWNHIESLEIKQISLGNCFLTRMPRFFNGGKIVFQQMVVETNGYPYEKKQNSKWIIELNTRAKIINS